VGDSVFEGALVDVLMPDKYEIDPVFLQKRQQALPEVFLVRVRSLGDDRMVKNGGHELDIRGDAL
jgi:hypothetical protein